jgi:hypothetical protein
VSLKRWQGQTFFANIAVDMVFHVTISSLRKKKKKTAQSHTDKIKRGEKWILLPGDVIYQYDKLSEKQYQQRTKRVFEQHCIDFVSIQSQHKSNRITPDQNNTSDGRVD